MSGGTVTITGGSGFVGQLLQSGLRSRGYQVDVFDRLRGSLVNVLRRTWTGADATPEEIPRARSLRQAQARTESALTRAGVLRPTWDDILDLRTRMTARFRGSVAVVHLAGLPHPNVPGADEEDYRRINFDGAVNVLAAAQEAGVPKFVFASSAQVYRINDPVRIDQFPILESNPLASRAEGQSAYGALKAEFEDHMARACRSGPTQGVALRLECPGVRSDQPMNLFCSTSVENTAAAFACAIESEIENGFESFNAIDGEIDPAIVDVQAFLAESWPDVPNHTRDNQSLLSIDKARTLLGYEPTPGGTHYPLALIWG